MKLVSFKFNIFDLNFILCITGFSFITTYMSFFPSVLYRAIALGIALFCLFKSGIRKIIDKRLKLFVLFLIIFALRLTYELIFGSDKLFSGKN